jgi:hypothetical protein
MLDGGSAGVVASGCGEGLHFVAGLFQRAPNCTGSRTTSTCWCPWPRSTWATMRGSRSIFIAAGEPLLAPGRPWLIRHYWQRGDPLQGAVVFLWCDVQPWAVSPTRQRGTAIPE